MLFISIMFAKITKSRLDVKNMTANFYDKDKTPIKTVHLGAAGYADYTKTPHDEDKKSRYIKRPILFYKGRISK